MITSLAQFITGYLIKNNIIDNTKFDIYIYGFEIMISNIICFSIGLIIGVIFSQLIEIIIFLIVFSLMRRYCGGYHADTYLKCDSIFAINIFVVMTLTRMISRYSIYAHFIIVCISFISILFLAPVENKYKPLTIEDKKKHKLSAIILAFMVIIISSILYFIKIQYSIITDMALITVAISMIIEVLKKGCESNEKYKESHS